MKAGIFLALSAFLIVVPAERGSAESAGDIAGVATASKAFYEALVVIDDGSAMANVWAQTPYVTYVGPRNTSIIVGWEAQKKYWSEFNKPFAQRSVKLVDAQVRVVGNLAWEIGTESGLAQMKDGSSRKVDWIVTNVYEKIAGRWLVVSHHVQPKPQ
ncbi:MAG TPA: nuclear transport factor 2 family protein [Bradyrhizobium sp.]|nr:nuclear transport factor 2 family protein [Bradyrhizobium sp.]